MAPAASIAYASELENVLDGKYCSRSTAVIALPFHSNACSATRAANVSVSHFHVPLSRASARIVEPGWMNIDHARGSAVPQERVGHRHPNGRAAASLASVSQRGGVSARHGRWREVDGACGGSVPKYGMVSIGRAREGVAPALYRAPRTPRNIQSRPDSNRRALSIVLRQQDDWVRPGSRPRESHLSRLVRGRDRRTCRSSSGTPRRLTRCSE
jgi:hypothetical protein